MKCRLCEKQFEPKPWNISCRDYRCPACKRKQQNEFNRRDPDFERKWIRKYSDRKEWYQEYHQKRKYDAVYIFKKKARRKLYYAIESGKIIKPEYCDECHKRKIIEAHHLNYKEPLNVKWTCRECHEKEHSGNFNLT